MAENQACQHGGEFLLANMTILFATSSGTMEKFDVIAPHLLPIVLIVFFAAVINIILIALVVQFIKRRFEGDYEKGDAKWVNLFPIPCLGSFASSILAYLVGMLIYRRFPHPLTTPCFCQLFYYHLSKGDGILPRLLPRWGLSEQLDCPIDRGP